MPPATPPVLVLMVLLLRQAAAGRGGEPQQPILFQDTMKADGRVDWSQFTDRIRAVRLAGSGIVFGGLDSSAEATEEPPERETEERRNGGTEEPPERETEEPPERETKEHPERESQPPSAEPEAAENTKGTETGTVSAAPVPSTTLPETGVSSSPSANLGADTTLALPSEQSEVRTEVSGTKPEKPKTRNSAVIFGLSSRFPVPQEAIATKEVAPANEQPVPECDGVPYMARNASGGCQFLMMQTYCPDGQWFLLDRVTREAACQPQPCPGKQVLFDGACRNRTGLCSEGMEVLVNEFGDADCDCAVRHIYYAARDRCYPAFRRGPCASGQYLTVTGGGVRCTVNRCIRDGTVFWPPAKRCHRLQDDTDSPCFAGRLDVNEETLELECRDSQLQLFAIFDLPIVRCSSGSKLDYRGACTPVLYQKFRKRLGSGASGARRCPEGFIKAPSGRCLKAAPAEVVKDATAKEQVKTAPAQDQVETAPGKVETAPAQDQVETAPAQVETAPAQVETAPAKEETKSAPAQESV